MDSDLKKAVGRGRGLFSNSGGINMLVRKGGFEPPRLSAPPPQDGVSASSTTSALKSIFCRLFEGDRSLHRTRRNSSSPAAPGRLLPMSLYTLKRGGSSSPPPLPEVRRTSRA